MRKQPYTLAPHFLHVQHTLCPYIANNNLRTVMAELPIAITYLLGALLVKSR